MRSAAAACASSPRFTPTRSTRAVESAYVRPSCAVVLPIAADSVASRVRHSIAGAPRRTACAIRTFPSRHSLERCPTSKSEDFKKKTRTINAGARGAGPWRGRAPRATRRTASRTARAPPGHAARAAPQVAAAAPPPLYMWLQLLQAAAVAQLATSVASPGCNRKRRSSPQAAPARRAPGGAGGARAQMRRGARTRTRRDSPRGLSRMAPRRALA